MADVFNWTGISSDHTSIPPTTNKVFSTPIANMTAGGYTEVNLTNVVDTSLRNGSLKLRFHISGRVSGGHNTIEVAAQEGVNRMRLVVTYTVYNRRHMEARRLSGKRLPTDSATLSQP